MTTLVFDIEANGLLDTVDTAWVFIGRELSGDSVVKLVNPSNYKELIGDNTIQPLTRDNLLGIISSYDCLIGHNIYGYDLPLLEKLYNININYNTHTIRDTLVMSKLLFPDRVGGHSVEAWGERFGMQKVGQESWDTFDPNMIHRCEVDVMITEKIYQRVMWEIEQ